MAIKKGDIVVFDYVKPKDTGSTTKYRVMYVNGTTITLFNLKNNKMMRTAFSIKSVRILSETERVLYGE